MGKRQRRVDGSVLVISLDEDKFAYAIVRPEPLISFYNITSSSILDVDDVVGSEIAFSVWVMNAAITSGRWTIIGRVELPQELIVCPDFFKVDPISKKYFIYRNSVDIPSTKGDCVGLERAAVWSAEHVESRLIDHFCGRENAFEKSLRP